MEIQEMYHGFRLIKKQTVKEADSEAYEFLHEKSGARLFYLSNEDDNKVFSIAFRTPPKDDTGVAHIVEHSTLCGSRKYPLKEPFVELVKGSLNTFLNAMTYPDKTMYPVASRNDQDFHNLMDVYLDAVFYPNIYSNPQILMQEGWHYEINKPEDPLQYSGVVYNEMKGVYSSPDSYLESRMMYHMFPDTTYGYESGGAPAAIPGLTQEMFTAFHKKFYHPSNSYIYLYGDMDIDAQLAYLDKEYLSHFDRIEVDSEIAYQKPFTAMKRVRESYPIGAEESTDGKTFLSLSMLTGETMDVETMLGLSILEQALLKSQAAPLRKALVDAHLGKDVDSAFETDLLQPQFCVIINGSEADQAERFYELVNTTLQQLVKDGLDRELMEATINSNEFKLRESDFGSFPKGLIYNIAVMRSWLYGDDPANALRFETALDKMKQGLNVGYFEQLIQEYLLDNPHKLLLVMEPSQTMAAEQAAAQEAELAAKKAAMTAEEIQHYIDLNRDLKERQQAPDSEEALATIPMLKLSDIRKTPERLPLEEREIDGVKVLYSNVPANGIVYTCFYFDAKVVPQEYLPYAYLLTALLGSVDTTSHSYGELANLQDLYTGGIAIDLACYNSSQAVDSTMPYFKLKVKALASYQQQAMELLQEILTTTQLSDAKRIHDLLEQEQMSIEMSMQRTAHQLVASRIASYITPAGRYNDEGELPYYNFVKDFLADFDNYLPKLQQVAGKLQDMLANRNGLIVAVACQTADYEVAAASLKGFVGALSTEKYPEAEYKWDLKAANEALSSSSLVQYVGRGANFRKLGFEFDGSMKVLETILRYNYFWTKIRVQGGAYGAMVRFDRNGFMFFGSYRDPNLAETNDVFKNTAAFLRQEVISDREMTKYIIGTMSGVDVPLTPRMKGTAAAEQWLRGITYADYQKAREQILATDQASIKKLADVVEACMNEGIICVFGNEAKIKANADLFGSIVPVKD